MPDTPPIPERFDSHRYVMQRYAENTPRMAFRDDPAWKPAAKKRLLELLGPMPSPSKLVAETGVATARPGYKRYPVTYAMRDGAAAFAYLLIPDDLKAPAPAVVCIPGHGRGVDDMVGITEKGTDRDAPDGYMHDFAIQCAQHGYVALAIEPIGFGHRRDAAAVKAGASSSTCQVTSGAALMLGETILGWRVWDAMRAIDYLTTRPEVDPGRIATMGISGGGTIGLYVGALDDRVKVSVLSCSFCTFRDSIYGVHHCIDNFVPGILRDFEMADITGLIAPRYLFCEAGSSDAIFPQDGVREAASQAKKIYQAAGVPDHFDYEIFEGGHLFHGEAAFRKLKLWL